MRIQKLDTTDGFIAVDLDQAARSSGIVRVARKILRDGAGNLARERTYSYASFGVRAGGASVGLNAQPDGAADAVAALGAELAERVADGSLVLTAGKGVPEDVAWSLSPASDVDTGAMNAISAVAAAGVAADGLDGSSVGVDADAPQATAVAERVATMGAEARIAPLPELGGSHLDVVFVGSRPGVFDHEMASAMDADVIVPIAPLAITAKALAVASRGGAVVLPGFATIAGETLAAEGGDGAGPESIADRVEEFIRAALDHDEGPFLGACRAAEEFLATWTDERPFGRPLA